MDTGHLLEPGMAIEARMECSDGRAAIEGDPLSIEARSSAGLGR